MLDYLQFKMPWRRRQPAGPPTRPHPPLCGSPVMQPVRRLQPVLRNINVSPTTTSRLLRNPILEFPSISTTTIFLVVRWKRSTKENWETVPVSSGIPFLNLLSPAWSGIFYKREQSAGLGTSWTRVTIRIVPGGQRRQR